MINSDSINTGSSACFKLATSNAELFTILESVFLSKQLGMKLIIVSQFQLFPTVSGALRFADFRPTQIRRFLSSKHKILRHATKTEMFSCQYCTCTMENTTHMDFVHIEQSILQTIGFKNTFMEKEGQEWEYKNG